MKKSDIVRAKIFLCFAVLFIMALVSFGLYSFLTAIITFGDPDGWDGYTVANSFALGNGTEDNPYIIQDASEFIYFQQLIEGDNSEAYQSLYYSLGNDIDFNGNAIKPIGIVDGEEERFFAGHLNGEGHSLKNFKINQGVTIEDTTYYSLFTKTKDAFIDKLTIDNYRIEVEDSEANLVVSPFIGLNTVSNYLNVEEAHSTFQNIILHNFNIDFSKVTTTDHSIFAFMGDASYSIVHNIYLDGEITSNLKNQLLSFFGGEEKPEITNSNNAAKA